MNKYELTVVLNVKLEDEERAAAIEKVKGYITRFGGTVTNVDEWGKKRLMKHTTTSSSLSPILYALTK